MISFKKFSVMLAGFALVAALSLIAPTSPVQAGGVNGPGPIVIFNQYPGGAQSALNVTAAAVIKASPGTVMRIVVVAAGSGGNLTVNDVCTTGAAAAANEIFTMAQSALSVGQVITLEFPVKNCITVSAVPTGSPQLSISYN
jgi:hypothetical protein